MFAKKKVNCYFNILLVCKIASYGPQLVPVCKFGGGGLELEGGYLPFPLYDTLAVRWCILGTLWHLQCMRWSAYV